MRGARSPVVLQISGGELAACSSRLAGDLANIGYRTGSASSDRRSALLIRMQVERADDVRPGKNEHV